MKTGIRGIHSLLGLGVALACIPTVPALPQASHIYVKDGVGPGGTAPYNPSSTLDLNLEKVSLDLSRKNVSGDLNLDKVNVVKAFMAARTLRHNVEARKLMTAGLEKRYLRGKRLSIRVRSGRVAAFDFSPAAIFPLGKDKFQVSVESTWVDLNNQVSSRVNEQIRFVKIRGDWLAEDIKFLRSDPRRPIMPFNVASEKRAKFAMMVAKRFMRHLIDRNVEAASRLLTQGFQSRFENQGVMSEFLLGSKDPAYVAFEVTSLVQTEPDRMRMGTTIYLAASGETGFERLDASLILHRGSLDWVVDEVEFKES